MAAGDKRLLLAGWLGLSALLSVLAYWQATQSFSRELSAELQQELPARLNEALQNRFNETDLFSLMGDKLNRDLSAIPATGVLPLINQCRGSVEQLLGRDAERDYAIALEWQLGKSPQRTTISLDCQINWPLLITSQSLLALLAVLLLALLPRPISSRRRAWISAFNRQGMPSRLASAVSAELERLSEIQLSWFNRARQMHGNDLDHCLEIALAADGIDFDSKACRVGIRGIPVKLSKTPYFYYLWYAKHRREGDGWQLNPPTNRPDHEGAASLIALMQACGGHNKAINDLRVNGLRAKTLDQNRNKIKDELIATLGEELAGDYLFDTERDLKTGRYRYRIATPAEQIFIAN